MNILLLTEFFDPQLQAVSGGIEARTSFIYRYLQPKHQIITISRRKKFVTTTFLSIFPRLAYILTSLISAIHTPQIDIIEGSNIISYLPAFAAAKIKKTPVIAWYPDLYRTLWFKYYSPTTALFGFILEWMSLKLPWDCIIAMSQSTQTKLIQAGINKKRIQVIYGGVDIQSINRFKVHKFTRPTIITICRLVNYKRVQDLLFALSKLLSSQPQLQLLVVGDGPEKLALQKLAAKLSIQPHVKFLGNLPHYRVMKLLKRCHIFSLASVVEGFGLVTVEALAAGIPYVSSDIPPTREITQNGQGGFLFTPKNPNDLTQKVLLLLQNKKLYHQKSKEALQLAQQYDWKLIATETESLYQRTLSSSS